MIQKIHRLLIIKYTCIIAGIMALCLSASYFAYRYNGTKMLHSVLKSYLSCEAWETKEWFKENQNNAEIHKISADIKTIYNFTYWLVGKNIIRAERPVDDNVNFKLEERLKNKNYISGKIYHENIKSNKKKWYFLLLKQDIKVSTTQTVKVFVLVNYTPVRRNSQDYLTVATISLFLIIFLSYFLGKFIASKSMKYIEQSFQKQKQFVSDAAHELRTPLATLYSYAELLEYKPDKHKVITDIKEEIQQMSEMVNRLLEIARYNNSAKKHIEAFLLNHLINASISSFKMLYPKVEFKVQGCDTDIKMLADKVMIRQLLNVLLDNAVKYTPHNPQITVSLKKINATLFEISVSDNGIGISPTDLPHIFDKFWRAEESRHLNGLGLGLSLAETIVNIHKGTINVQSTFGKGSTFVVKLPLNNIQKS